MTHGEWNPKELLLIGRKSVAEKVAMANLAARTELDSDTSVYFRQLSRANKTSVDLYCSRNGQSKTVRMFGSNNYLGLAFDPRVIEAAHAAAQLYGMGVGGSCYLNGNSALLRRLEEATAALKGFEDCIVFSSGYCANTSWTSALIRPVDTVACDSESHMSFREGIRGTGAMPQKFSHNSLVALEDIISRPTRGDKYVFVEGLYSMTGDVADIPAVYALTRKYGAMLVIDDAHGTGTLGATGRGILEGLAHGGDIVLIGTYSKALGANGGFICGSRGLVNCLRMLAPSYMFSTALSPASVGAALAAVGILISEPERVTRLRTNARLANGRLRRFSNVSHDTSPIIYLKSGDRFDVRRAAKTIEEMGCFVNAISFPAVGRRDSGLRIGISSEHTESDIRFLESCVDQACHG